MNNKLRYQNQQIINIRRSSVPLVELKVRNASNFLPKQINQTSNITQSSQIQKDVKLRAKEEKWERIKEDVRKQFSENQNKAGQENLFIYFFFFLFLLTTLYFAPYQFYEPKAPKSYQ